MMHRSNRPRPIADAMRSQSWVTVLGALITAGVAFGLLNTVQETWMRNMVAAAATVLVAATSALSQLGVLTLAEPEVTPTSDPRGDDGAPLVPADVERPPATPDQEA